MERQYFGRVGALVLFGSLLAPQVYAEDLRGSWYGALRLGVTDLQNTSVAGLNLTSTSLFPSPTNIVSYKPGWTGSVAAGYAVDEHARLEIEIGENRNAVRRAFGNPTTILGVGTCIITNPNCASVGATGGAMRAETYMAKGFYDFPTAWPVTPFIGVGLGIANIHEEQVGQPRGVLLNGSVGSFAYSATAGVSYDIGTRVAIDVAYRYLGATSQHFRANRFGTPAADLQLHALIAGVRYRFL